MVRLCHRASKKGDRKADAIPKPSYNPEDRKYQTLFPR